MADITGKGTILTWGTTTTVTSVIGVVTNISGPNETTESIECTDFASANAEFIPGMNDPGEMTLDLKYDETNAGVLDTVEKRSDATAATSRDTYFQIRFNDHTTSASRSTWMCKGFITALGHAVPNDGIVTQSVTIKFSGKPTFTAHA
jgi:hypothetical protein